MLIKSCIKHKYVFPAMHTYSLRNLLRVKYNKNELFIFSTCQDLKNKSNHKTIVSRFTRSQCLFLFTTIFGASFLILYPKNSDKKEFGRKNIKVDLKLYNKHDTNYFDDRFTIYTEGCSIPGFKPLNKAIKQYIFYPTVKPCRNSSFPLLNNNRTHIWIRDHSRKHYGTFGIIICCYKSFYRPTTVDITSDKVDDRVQYNECITFTRNIKVSDEFVKVECVSNNTLVYKQFFSFVPKKSFSQNGVKEIAKRKSAYNVLILGIDAVSRLNFQRSMPKTLQFLKTKGAIELLGYNKVGDNTFPNIIPMLLGIKSTELRKTCLPNPWSTFDNCPFIWEWFKQAGYYTAFGEDSSSLGTFNYLRSGFMGTPTDYYLHTFINEAEKDVGNNKDFNSFLCMNEKPFYKVLLNYIENVASTLKSTKLFGFFWEVTMSHDYLNYPTIMDTDYERFLSKLHITKYLDKTILFLVSDHGLRWGEMRFTVQGRLEERLPFVHVLIPQSFRHKYGEAYKNLELNSQRLTTPFDIHATLHDLLDLDNVSDEQIRARTLTPYGQNRGISLFLPIPSNRTCEMAEIDDQWCTCQRSHKISLDSEEALNATAEVLRHVNNLLIGYSQCAVLRLVEIMDALEIEFGTFVEDSVNWREFMVVIRTEPGNAIFEATLRHKDDWSLAGTVSRLNLYGDQSHCVSNSQLKLYCYCV